MKIVIELDHTDTPELVAALLSAVSNYQKTGTAETSNTPPVVKAKGKGKQIVDAPPAETVAAAEETEQKPEDIGEVKEEAPPTIEQIRGLVAEKLKAGHKEKVKAWVSEYGAEGVSTIPADKYADFMAKLKTL